MDLVLVCLVIALVLTVIAATGKVPLWAAMFVVIIGLLVWRLG